MNRTLMTLMTMINADICSNEKKKVSVNHDHQGQPQVGTLSAFYYPFSESSLCVM